MNKVIIKFTGSWRGYSAGEIAGFPEDVAQSLVEGGRAELHEQKKTTKGAATRPKPASSKAGATQPQPGQGEPNPDVDTDPDSSAVTVVDPDAAPNPDDDDQKP
ncbi:MAG TPA: hypothetical protein DGQ94_10740 [Pseudomonas sp.]|nr:hypothetical protein [Pseudomonas sp.]